MDVTNKKEFNLNDLFTFFSFLDVIDGLNKYFAEDETRVRVPRSFVEIKGPSKVIFYRFDAEMYLDKLIAWLRTEHGIFYYPGMEAKYAKTERIPPFTERMKNDGALRTLKKLHKIVTNVEVSDKADSPTLIAAAIENDFAVLKQDLKNALEAKESFFETKGKLNYRKEHILKDLYRDILHKQPDGLSDEDIATKILDKMLEMKERLDRKEGGITMSADEFTKAFKARDEYAESLSRNTERSDINKLISDYCNKFDIIPPSPDSSDKACVEYLFSVVDLERKHRAAVGKQMVNDYEKDLLKFIYKEYRNRTHLNEETITYNPPNICNTITKIIRDYARSRTRVDILEGRIKRIFDKYKTKFTVDDQVINGDPTISFMLDCIWSWIGSSAELKQKCDFLEDGGRSCCGIGFDPSTYKTDYMPRSTYETKKEAFLKALDEPYDEEEELP